MLLRARSDVGRSQDLYLLLQTIYSYVSLSHHSKLMLLLLLFTVSVALEAAQLTPEQVLKRRQLLDLCFSPDNTQIAITVAEPIKGAEQKNDIWIWVGIIMAKNTFDITVTIASMKYK